MKNKVGCIRGIKKEVLGPSLNESGSVGKKKSFCNHLNMGGPKTESL